VEHYNKPCGVHERQKPPCLQKYNEFCSIHTRNSNSLVKQDEPVGTTVCPKMEAMFCPCPSGRQPMEARRTADYSRWPNCRLPAHEIERQIRERREEEERVKKQKEKEQRTRQILKEKKMELRPQCPPPRNMNHRAEVPCEHCEPKPPKEKPIYPPTNEPTPICPPMEQRNLWLKRGKSLELKLPCCNCK
jgi:hypothetical protein